MRLSLPAINPAITIAGFILFDLFIVSVFVQHVRTKAVTSHFFTSLFVFINLPLIHFAPRLLIDFKNRKWLTYFCILLCIFFCFSHLIALFSVAWIFLLYKFTRFLENYFMFLSDEWPTLETLYFIICIGSTPTLLYFDFFLYFDLLLNYLCCFIYLVQLNTYFHCSSQC